MAWVGAIIGLVGTAFSAAGQVRSSQQQAEFNKAYYGYNQKVAANAVDSERRRAAFEIEQHRNRVARLIGSQRAVSGGQGLDDGGWDLEFDTRLQSNLDEQMIRYNSELNASKWTTEAGINLLKAGQSDSIREAGYMEAGSTIIKGTGSSILMYDQYKAKNTMTAGV